MFLLLAPSPPPLPLLYLKSPIFPRSLIPFSKTTPKPSRKSLSISSCSAPNTLPSTDQEILQTIAQFDENNTTSGLPAVRTYENDLARLSLVGDVSFQQALTAAAADGGKTADEYLDADVPSMVVETVFPGPSDESSTVSTRLFLPARKVKEKARKLRSTLPEDIVSSSTSKNILAMTFRQVVLQSIWSFELQLFSPGAERNMKDLENPREVSALFTVSSSDERVLSVLAEAVCICALESTEMDSHEGILVRDSKSFIDWFQMHRKIVSKDFSVIIYKLSQDELVKNAKLLFAKFNSMEMTGPREMKTKYRRRLSSIYSKLEKIGGPEFITWISEYQPAYKLQVDANILKNVKFEGWKESAENRWEVLLTHSQMVEFAGILDMYYEDTYTLPDKQLLCGVVSEFSKLSKNKTSTSLWRKLVIAIVGAFIVVFISALSQIYRPRLHGVEKSPAERVSISSSETALYQHEDLDSHELESACISVVEKIKNAVGWQGGIETDPHLGAWTGKLPSYIRKLHGVNEEAVLCTGEDMDTVPTGFAPSQLDLLTTMVPPSDQVNTANETSAEDIASYQVVLSKDGSVVGFQPTSRVAVNFWASNPLAKELYSGRKLTPGIIEPGLKIRRPEEIILIELLMSVNPESWFALARPLRTTH